MCGANGHTCIGPAPRQLVRWDQAANAVQTGDGAMDILQKLQVKDQSPLFVWHAPEPLTPMLDHWAESRPLAQDPAGGPYPFVLLFTRDRAELEQAIPVLKQAADPAGLIWVAYPKKSAPHYRSDLSRDDFWHALEDLGLEPVRQIAIDDDWSALRFKPGDRIARNSP